MPSRSTATGISATEGTGRRNSIVEAVNSRRNGLFPMITPITTPATTEIASPRNQVVTV